MTERIYLVVDPVPLVAEDLALCIAEGDTGAAVLTALDLKSAIGLIAGHAAIRAAFLHHDPAQVDSSPLGKALQAKGAQVIFVGAPADRSGTQHVLELPFSPETVADALRRLDEA